MKMDHTSDKYPFADVFFRRALAVITAVTLFLSSPVASAESSRYKVKDVVDGDTVKLYNGQAVRYLGIDTPEMKKRRGKTWIYSPEPFAVDAVDFNKRMVQGKTVRLEFDRRHEDKYDRWLCYVFDGSVMVNEELLRSGYAVITILSPNIKYTDRLVAAQAEAIAARRGMWKDLKAMGADDALDHVGSVVRIRGKVKGTSVGKNALYINFECAGKKAVPVVIWGYNLYFFEQAHIEPEDFKGKEIEVTGKVKDFNGPVLVVFHPSQIRVVSK
jgi:micrococcal nuclease